MREAVDGIRGESMLWSPVRAAESRNADASGISMGGSEGILGKSICLVLVVMLKCERPHP